MIFQNVSEHKHPEIKQLKLDTSETLKALFKISSECLLDHQIYQKSLTFMTFFLYSFTVFF